VALVGLGFGDVDYVVEQVRFAVLTAEVLLMLVCRLGGCVEVVSRTDPADNVIVVGQMCLAVLASVYLGRVEVDVVGEAHVCSDKLVRGMSARLRHGIV
jgi:hypothetical protein